MTGGGIAGASKLTVQQVVKSTKMRILVLFYLNV